MASHTDLSGIFHVQKALINDISTQLSNSTNIDVNTNLYDEVQKMQADLDNYNTSFQSANESSSQVLSRQDDVQQLLNEEYNRLVMKQMNIDNAVQGRRRGAFLNDNYKQRYSHYTKIVIIFICTLVTIYLLTNFKEVIPLPDYAINFIMLIIVVVALMMCYFNYMTILVRDKIYFDEKSHILEWLDKFQQKTMYPKSLCMTNKLGILLYGPAGTGKTGCISAIANKLHRDILIINSLNLLGEEGKSKF